LIVTSVLQVFGQTEAPCPIAVKVFAQMLSTAFELVADETDPV
jgi:hypothetical protein